MDMILHPASILDMLSVCNLNPVVQPVDVMLLKDLRNVEIHANV